jgi:hypothetical protein
VTWIRTEITLPRHPKTRRLSRALNLKRRETVGLLILLWTWAIEYAPSGELSGFAAEDLADATDWKGDIDRLVDALVESGFVDREGAHLRLHDWDSYQGHLLVKRQANAARQAKWREKKRNALHNATGNAPVTPLRDERNVRNERTNGTRKTNVNGTAHDHDAADLHAALSGGLT